MWAKRFVWPLAEAGDHVRSEGVTMDKELFRLILLVCGVALVAIVYYWDRLRGLFSRRSASPVQQPMPARPQSDPVVVPAAVETSPAAEVEEFDTELGELEALIRADEPIDVLLQDPPQVPRETEPAADDGTEGAQSEQVVPTPPQILAVTLVATSGNIGGIRLRRVLTDHGLGLGSSGMFERIGEEGRPLYSAANLVEPGTFDPLTLDGLSTPGLVLFQVLEGSGDHAEIFDAMLETATRLADRLDCTLCDTRRERLVSNGIAALRAKAEQAGDQAAP